MSDIEKPRITMREQAFEIASTVAGHERPTAAHLEEAILLLKTEAAGKSGPVNGITDEFFRSETDQLYRELVTEIRSQSAALVARFDRVDIQIKAAAASLDTIRQMLNIFGEEMAGADTAELFKEANEIITQVLKPLALETKERLNTPTKIVDNTRGSQREETEEIQSREDPDLEANGHTVVQGDRPKEPQLARDNGRG